ncbi:MAG: D-glycerate dehydrogenase [Candidatus Yanofskybacteria bacterium CG10_big_fil_rev_8_21_14_0_10_46_23]|uniref:D-glycerate dehydrogenase n=1 Tax=Candidatus Yanofskybacteria bacterium CG10_big_fil_rev_8_21_14_0_10_46_23 TaxID=1975098 RepID=A0A2H0R4U2_9BACT|nr:MAG: D-glycerate dehydrogenase [Candidatus Yanofskybacteria bacterium CG10_big_fil_rev_8_21_14_0_10_46_23]
MAKIFVTRPIPKAGLDLLKKAGHEVSVNDQAEDRPATREEILRGAKEAEAILSVLTEKIDGAVFENAPNLKIVANYAVGFDNIDLEAARARGILVTNTPGILTNTVAEHTFTLLLAIAHRVTEADRFIRGGKYKAWGPKLLLGQDLFGKTLGIVGLGRIGSRVAHHATRGFEMKIIYNDLEPTPEFEVAMGATFESNLDVMLSQADFVSIHVPLVASTRHLINARRLSLMKKTAFLVNTSRGPVIDEVALVQALKNNQIRGAALDVFENEPELAEGLAELDNVIITPHIASGTEETRDKMSIMAAENIIAGLNGETPPNLIG